MITDCELRKWEDFQIMLCKRHGTEQRDVANVQDPITVMRDILDVLIRFNGKIEDVEKDLTHRNHFM